MARIYDAWLGGKDNFRVDRDIATEVARIAPFVVAGARANRAFLRRAVTHLARAGIEQFLDLGSGLPGAGNVHEVAQHVTPGARVVYLDRDPVVLAHARALLACDDRTIVVAGDLAQPRDILKDPELTAHLDFSRPLAVLMAVLHFVTAPHDPAAIVSAFRDELTPGSYLAISHVADEIEPSDVSDATTTAAAAHLYRDLAGPFTTRSRAEIEGMFDGFRLLAPGLVAAARWRPDGDPLHAAPILAGVGYVPGNSPQDCQPFPERRTFWPPNDEEFHAPH